jgi:hypothetical protein
MRVGDVNSAMFKLTLYAVTVLGVLTGCATSASKDHGSTVANAEPDKQCHVENITGTFVKKNVCSTRADRDAEQRTIEDLQYRVGTAQPTSLLGGGNGH